MTVAKTRNITTDRLLSIICQLNAGLKKEILNSLSSVAPSPALLNRHGNAFHGEIRKATTKPGIIKNIRSPYIEKKVSKKPPIYNPLNRHGNTFQGLPRGASTVPGTIKNIHKPAIEKESFAKMPAYITTNKHGTQFQGIPFNKSREDFPPTTPVTTQPRPAQNGDRIENTEIMPEYPKLEIPALSKKQWDAYYTTVYVSDCDIS
ncbi:hypothetical protein [Erwinia tasmaniensis]|uniref:Uncharacterized protein n=1 Tax=Erwinia tasmaniensis (strain DSM 17950 / CFBP 7177 / CIP 109463 / NCPPB 4357 / Et1/99) TaxID=465817 RepID=B2VIR8_ERWT9|nr:hypothetical protein [Erwinia tasmaniensis]CAO97597.1 hypothetical protein ETA_25510 [Erwinia tasmaniensis Et1/99]